MAGILRLTVSADVAELSRDLRSFGDDLDRPLRDALEYGATTIARSAVGFMRHGQPSWPTSSAARDYGSFPGAIASYYRARVATINASVLSDHPAAPVWEYGGSIHPLAHAGLHAAIRSTTTGSPRRKLLEAGTQTIVIPRTQPVTNAGDAAREDITQHLESAVTDLIREHGLG
jgi:hypothetical protein